MPAASACSQARRRAMWRITRGGARSVGLGDQGDVIRAGAAHQARSPLRVPIGAEVSDSDAMNRCLDPLLAVGGVAERGVGEHRLALEGGAELAGSFLAAATCSPTFNSETLRQPSSVKNGCSAVATIVAHRG